MSWKVLAACHSKLMPAHGALFAAIVDSEAPPQNALTSRNGRQPAALVRPAAIKKNHANGRHSTGWPGRWPDRRNGLAHARISLNIKDSCVRRNPHLPVGQR